MEEDEITSLGRIRKRNCALVKLGSAEMPAPSSFEIANSPPIMSTDLARTPGSEDRRRLKIESSPWVPPLITTGFYLKPQANTTTNTLPSSDDRRRTILARKLSSMSLRRRGTGDIWEQASEDNEIIVETQSLPGSKKKGTGSRGLRRGIEKIMWKPREGMHTLSGVSTRTPKLGTNDRTDKLTSSPIDYVAAAEARRQDLSSLPKSVYGSSPLAASTTALSDTRSLYTPSSQNEFPSCLNCSDEYTEYIHPHIQDGCATPAVLSSSRPGSRPQFTPSPLFGRFPSRSLSLSSRCDRKIDGGVSLPALPLVQPVEVPAMPPVLPAANMWLSNSQKSYSPKSINSTGKMSVMAPTEIYTQIPIPVPTNPDLILPKVVSSQVHIPVSSCLTLMGPKSIFSQEPIPNLLRLTIMEPMIGYSQVSMPADSPMFYFALSIILPLFLSTTQALTFALHHVGEEMSYKLINEIVKGWLVGALVGIVVHTFVRGAIRVPEDVLYFLAWATESLVRTVRIFVEKLVRGFRDGKGNDI
jgi:hypothetical protein